MTMAQRTALSSNPTVRAWVSEPPPLSTKNLIPSTTGLVRRQQSSTQQQLGQREPCWSPKPRQKDHKHTGPRQIQTQTHPIQTRFSACSRDKRREGVPEAQPLQFHISTAVPTSRQTRDLRLYKGANHLRQTGLHWWTLLPSPFEKTCMQHLPPGPLARLTQKCHRTHSICTLSAAPRE